MSDREYGFSPQSPAAAGIGITPADSNLAKNARALYIGVGGDVAVQFAGGAKNIVTFKNVPTGTFMPLTVVQVRNTNTTATDIVVLYE